MSVIYLNPNMSISDAILKLSKDEAHTIYLAKGVYKEKLMIEIDHLTIIGESAYNTMIVFNDFSYKMHEDGLLFNTFRTSTVTITGNYTKLKNLTIKNDSGHGERIGQAIALSLYGKDTLIDNCILDGNQDTLFIGPLPLDLTIRYSHILPLSMRHTNVYNHYIKDSKIIGNVDFIFGSGNAFFKNCDLVFNKDGYLAAPSTYKGEIGLVFKACRISKLSPDDMIVLARPWRAFGTAIFYDCTYLSPISPERFNAWGQTEFSFYEEPYIPNPLSYLLDSNLRKHLDEIFNKF